jgi:hypothetical protein
MTISIKSPTSTTGSIQKNGSDVLTIDSSDNVTVVNNLSVSGTVSSTGAITFDGGVSGNVNFDSGTLYVDATNNRVGIGTSSPTNNLQIYNSGATSGQIHITNSSTGATATDGVLFGYDGSNDVLINNQEATAMKFNNNGSERMRIDSSGNLLVGTTSGYDGGGGHTFKSPTNNFITTWRTTTSTGNYIHAFVSDVGGVGTAKYAIYANGTAGAISDENYKKNIELARDYLSDINQINVIKYNWKTDEEDANKEIGFSAQQVETIFPTMVDTVTASLEDGSEITHKMLKKDVFLPMAIKCIQELSAKIEDLETRIQALENPNG